MQHRFGHVAAILPDVIPSTARAAAEKKDDVFDGGAFSDGATVGVPQQFHGSTTATVISTSASANYVPFSNYSTHARQV